MKHISQRQLGQAQVGLPGHLGQKAKAGFFKKVGRDILRFELESGEYVPAGAKVDEVYGRMLKRPAAERPEYSPVGPGHPDPRSAQDQPPDVRGTAGAR